MDWTRAIARQRTALAGILATLVAMAAGEAGTLPRHLHRAVLRLLRPAEAAARRLVIALARTLPAPPAQKIRPLPPRPAGPKKRPSILTNRVGTGILMPPAPPPAATAARTPSLPLFDRLRKPWQQARPVPAGVPRISVPGCGKLFAIAARFPPAPDDPIDAARLRLRLRALAAVLDDLPAAARRFARWQARLNAAAALGVRRGGPEKMRRLWPIKPGRPPGWRRRPADPVHEALNEAHWLAFMALERRDTS